MFMWNRLLNHAHYGDQSFAGDSVGLGLGQRLNYIFKKLILRFFGAKSPLMEKILFKHASKSSVNLCYEWRLGTNMTPLASSKLLHEYTNRD